MYLNMYVIKMCVSCVYVIVYGMSVVAILVSYIPKIHHTTMQYYKVHVV